MNEFTSILDTDQFSQFRRRLGEHFSILFISCGWYTYKVKVAIPRELLGLSFTNDIAGDATELAQRSVGCPAMVKNEIISRMPFIKITHIRLSAILHISRAARAGIDQPRLRQISNMARRILEMQVRKVRYSWKLRYLPASRLLNEDHVCHKSKP